MSTSRATSQPASHQDWQVGMLFGRKKETKRERERKREKKKEKEKETGKEPSGIEPYELTTEHHAGIEPVALHCDAARLTIAAVS